MHRRYGTASPTASASRAGDSESSESSCEPNRQLRVTLVECLLNTNISGGGWGTVHALRQFLEQSLFTVAGSEACIALESGQPRRHLLRVEVQAAVIEEGSERGFIHAHWVWKITHADRVVLGRMAPQTQQYVRAKSIFSGAFVSIRLLNAAPENYALKGRFLCDEER